MVDEEGGGVGSVCWMNTRGKRGMCVCMAVLGVGVGMGFNIDRARRQAETGLPSAALQAQGTDPSSLPASPPAFLVGSAS